MRVHGDSKGCQGTVLFSQDRKILNQVKTSGVHEIISYPNDHASQENSLQAVNNTILRHMQSLEIVCKELVSGELIQKSNNLENIVVLFIDKVNGLLRIINKEKNDHTIVPNTDNDTIQRSLRMVNEIIISALDISDVIGEEDLLHLSSIGVKRMKDGLFGIDNEVIKETISSNGKEVAKTFKMVSSALLETMPFCIDPNTGNLRYIRKKLKEDGDDSTSRVSGALSERLEREKIELMKKLNITELLISRSSQFIENLEISSELCTDV